MIASMQININHCRVWLFYNEMGAVAQCPNNWGVGSAFHPKKIHIFPLCYPKGVHSLGLRLVQLPTSVWLFYNEMGAVARCPNNWGVGSAFHPKKIHIYYDG